MTNKEMAVQIVALVLSIGLLASPVACTMRKHQLIADAIKSGADPTEARCAIDGDPIDPRCILAAARGKKAPAQ